MHAKYKPHPTILDLCNGTVNTKSTQLLLISLINPVILHIRSVKVFCERQYKHENKIVNKCTYINFCVISDVIKNRAAHMQLYKNHLLVQEMDWPKSESKQLL